MSLVQSLILRMRRTFSWSTSAESWHERYIAWALIAVTLLLAAFTFLGGVTLTTRADGSTIQLPSFSGWLLITVWSVWLVAVLLLVRFGQLKLFGPVLFYDMVRSARRSRYFLLRGFYSLVLLLILFFVWMSVPPMNISPRERASRLAMDFFEIFSVVQLVAVMLLTPAYVAGAVSEEKDRKTLEFLLATDLRNREIVLSKLLSRLAHLTLFLLTGLPILGLLQFLGGIDPNLVLAGFGFTMVTMIGLGGMSILNSVVYKRPRDSIAISYLFLIGYMALTTVLFSYQPPAVFRFGPGPVTPPTELEEQLFEALYTGNIFVLLAKVFRSGAAGTLSADLPGLFFDYALFWGSLAIVCVLWSIVRLRGIALKQNFAKVKLSQQAKDRPPVGEMPMLWKEVHVEGSLRLNWMAWILVLLLVLATFANPFVWLVQWFYFGDNWQGRDVTQELNLWVRIAGTGVALLTILGVAIRAANSIGNERERQTMDGLLITPLDSTSILGAKFVGSLCSVRLGWVWLGSIYVIALVSGALHIFALPLVLAAWFVFSSVAALIGLGYSMSSHSTLRATVYTVLTCMMLGAGHWLIWFCCGPLLFLTGGAGNDGGTYLVKFQLGVTPPAMLVFFSFEGEEFRADFGDRFMVEAIGFSIFGLFLWALAGLFYWNGVLVPRFRALTRRQEDALGRGEPPPPVPKVKSDSDSAVGVAASE